MGQLFFLPSNFPTLETFLWEQEYTLMRKVLILSHGGGPVT